MIKPYVITFVTLPPPSLSILPRVYLPAFTIIFHCPYRITASSPQGWMLCSISCRGDFFPLDRVSQMLYPSTCNVLELPLASSYNVGSQSVTCIRPRFTRPVDANRGLWTMAAPRTPPVLRKGRELQQVNRENMTKYDRTVRCTYLPTK